MAYSKSANKEYQRKWYANNKNKQIAKTKQRRLELTEWFKEFKLTQSCVKCSENHPATLDFHHLIPANKHKNIAILVNSGVSILTLQKELNKCICLCSNCHRKLHWDEKQL